jgi:adenylate kinase
MDNQIKIYIGGVGGVGKTTLSKALAEELDAVALTGSEIMMQLCNVDSREQLETYSPKEKELIERERYPELLSNYPRIIVDGHCKLYPEQISCFKHFFLLEATPETILQRRIERGRREPNIEIIKEEMEIYKRRTEQLSEYGAHFIRIENEKDLSIAKKEIITYLN